MAKLRKKGPCRLGKSKADSTHALNGDLFRIVAEMRPTLSSPLMSAAAFFLLTPPSKKFSDTLPRS